MSIVNRIRNAFSGTKSQQQFQLTGDVVFILNNTEFLGTQWKEVSGVDHTSFVTFVSSCFVQIGAAIERFTIMASKLGGGGGIKIVTTFERGDGRNDFIVTVSGRMTLPVSHFSDKLTFTVDPSGCGRLFPRRTALWASWRMVVHCPTAHKGAGNGAFTERPQTGHVCRDNA